MHTQRRTFPAAAYSSADYYHCHLPFREMTGPVHSVRNVNVSPRSSLVTPPSSAYMKEDAFGSNPITPSLNYSQSPLTPQGDDGAYSHRPEREREPVQLVDHERLERVCEEGHFWQPAQRRGDAGTVHQEPPKAEENENGHQGGHVGNGDRGHGQADEDAQRG